MKRKLVTREEIVALGYNEPFNQDRIMFYLNNELLPRLTMLHIDYRREQYENYRQGRDYSRKWVTDNVDIASLMEKPYRELLDDNKHRIDESLRWLLLQSSFYEELLNAHHPLNFLAEKEYDYRVGEKSFSGGNLDSWMRALCHHYPTTRHLAYRYSQTFLELDKEFNEAIEIWERKMRENPQAEFPYWLEYEISWFVHEKFKESHGVLPQEIQDQIFEDVKNYLEQIRNDQ